MSRIGKKPISVPQGVKVALDGATVRAEGPKGKLSQSIPSGLSVTMESNVLTVARSSDHRNVRALHGLTRSLLANMVHGVKDGFERKLEIVGIGYLIRQSSEFSPANVTNILLVSLQIIVLLLALILFFVLARNVIKLY